MTAALLEAGITPFARWVSALVPAVYPSHAALARAVGTSEANVSRWRKGTVPSVPMLVRLAAATGTSMETLLKIAGYEGPVSEDDQR